MLQTELLFALPDNEALFFAETGSAVGAVAICIALVATV